MTALIHGIVLAFGLILPLGVQNVFVFNQGATQRKLMLAIPAVLTASLCDTFLILLAVLGVSLIVLTFGWLQAILYGLGFVFLVYMAWSIWNSKPNSADTNNQALSVKKQVIFAASVSLLNPHAIIDIFGVIGTSSVAYSGTDKVLFTIACVLVSWVWFAGLAVAGRWVGQIDPSGKLLLLFNRVSSVIIWGAASYIGWQLIKLILSI